MYFGVSNGQYKSSQLLGRGQGPPPLSSYKHPRKCPELSSYGVLPQRVTERLEKQRAVVFKKKKKAAPRKILPRQSLSKGKSSLPPPNLSAEATFVSFGGERMGEEEKKNALGESWGSDKGLKGGGGLRSSFGVPLVCRERFPLGLGLGLCSPQVGNPSSRSFGMTTRRRVQGARL